MPYNKRKQKCTQSDGDKGSYVLSYTTKKGDKRRACHTSKKNMQGQIAAIEAEADDASGETLEENQKVLRVTKRQLRKIIRESISRNEIQNIERLWWNQDPDGGDYPQRDMASALIDTLGIDRKSLRLWTLVYPWGELYEPWGYYGGGEMPGFTGNDVTRILDYFNSNNATAMDVNFKDESGFAELTLINDVALDEDLAEDIAAGIERADFETS